MVPHRWGTPRVAKAGVTHPALVPRRRAVLSVDHVPASGRSRKAPFSSSWAAEAAQTCCLWESLRWKMCCISHKVLLHPP